MQIFIMRSIDIRLYMYNEHGFIFTVNGIERYSKQIGVTVSASM